MSTYVYLIVDMLELDNYSGFEPLLSTYIGHPTNGLTILKYLVENAPENDNLLTEEQYQHLISSGEWAV